MKVDVITTITPAIAEAIGRLVSQLSSTSILPSPDHLLNMISAPGTSLFMARTSDGKYVGMLTLVVVNIPIGVKAIIEDVVVDSEHRRQGIAEALTETALKKARNVGARSVDLTSHPSRVAANALYRKIGFELRETNPYRMSRASLENRS